ncbi:MAG: acyl-CoA thioesterase [Rhabdochlamydiaceae bacterium]|nr:acyl-CoA thioesterase [Rhabdochlamydiaceae bacterium]
MFTHRVKIRLQSTDATGVLYFTEQLKFAMETFEEFIEFKGFNLKQLLDFSILLPVVHVEADYAAALHVSDEIEVGMAVEKVGSSSITLCYQLFDVNRQIQVGKVKIVHVAVDRTTQASVPLPDCLKMLFAI